MKNHSVDAVRKVCASKEPPYCDSCRFAHHVAFGCAQARLLRQAVMDENDKRAKRCEKCGFPEHPLTCEWMAIARASADLPPELRGVAPEERGDALTIEKLKAACDLIKPPEPVPMEFTPIELNDDISRSIAERYKNLGGRISREKAEMADGMVRRALESIGLLDLAIDVTTNRSARMMDLLKTRAKIMLHEEQLGTANASDPWGFRFTTYIGGVVFETKQLIYKLPA